MVVVKTPFRVSLFGGGTDYPAWYNKHGIGKVIGFAVDYYSYVACQKSFMDSRYFLRYASSECVDSIEDIQHRGIRACLQFIDPGFPVHITHIADLPTRSGLGSSSSFTVGLLSALHELRKRESKDPTMVEDLPPGNVAICAWHVEQNMMGEAVGSQDQVFAAIGDVRTISFYKDKPFETKRLMGQSVRRTIEDHLFLVPTGMYRSAATIAQVQIDKTPELSDELEEMMVLVDEAEHILCSGKGPEELGKLLIEGWKIKKSLTPLITNDDVDSFLRKIDDFAYGYKLIGAGGGGFILVCTDEDAVPSITRAVGQPVLPVRIATNGSRLIAG